MNPTAEVPTSNRTRRALWPLSPSVRTHLLIVGVALVGAGALTLRLLPDLSLWWVVAAVFIITHIGLLMVLGSAALRWAGRRRPD